MRVNVQENSQHTAWLRYRCLTPAGLQQHLSLLRSVLVGAREQLDIQHPPGLPPEPTGLPAPLLLRDSAAVRAEPLFQGVSPDHSSSVWYPQAGGESPQTDCRPRTLHCQLQTSGAEPPLLYPHPTPQPSQGPSLPLGLPTPEQG